MVYIVKYILLASDVVSQASSPSTGAAGSSTAPPALVAAAAAARLARRGSFVSNYTGLSWDRLSLPGSGAGASSTSCDARAPLAPQELGSLGELEFLLFLKIWREICISLGSAHPPAPALPLRPRPRKGSRWPCGWTDIFCAGRLSATLYFLSLRLHFCFKVECLGCL